MTGQPSPDIRFERRGALGLVILDRQRALNALTHAMVRAMSAQLLEWAEDPEVGAVIVKAVPGRAFCAGGDVRAVSRAYATEGLTVARRFFWDEYRLNWRIKHYPKPYIAILDGVTMGGGVGISVHGRWRITTGQTILAMPETAIGMFPDVGGTYALTHLTNGNRAFGMFMALTGARLGPAECIAMGLADRHVPSTYLGELEDRLAAKAPQALAASLTAGDDLVGPELASVARKPGDSSFSATLPMIDRCFSYPTIEEILAALRDEPTGWGAEQLGTLRRMSPLAVRLTFEQLRAGADLSFDDALRLEYRIIQRVLERGDFHEGVRALLIDKDKTPRWKHASIEAVPGDEVERFMAPLDDPAEELVFDWHSD